MELSQLLKNYRKQNCLTQQQVATKLFVTTQAVSKWELGQSVPNVDNLLALSDLYNISIDELVQGSPFFKKPYRIGKRYQKQNSLLLIGYCLLFALIISQMVGNFLMNFLIALVVLLLLMLPIAFTDYWVIEQSGISVATYSKKPLGKIKQLLKQKPEINFIGYQNLQEVTLLYRRKIRTSPFDFGPDSFTLSLISGDKKFPLNLEMPVKEFLPQFAAFLERQNIPVIDQQKLISSIVSGENLFQQFNSK
ncbi:helix-turn-helix domain-containing protein [Enterococcus sp. HY326]|uniref:helix-turn-helix domain-containing protein n=1 Tax=Enterococcus sp. HY326 TaxID=2971265 RepID=UPI00223EC58A|nr:helix-turn-helix transcriptional regulator [Enterococcus sp. HY326]